MLRRPSTAVTSPTPKRPVTDADDSPAAKYAKTRSRILLTIALLVLLFFVALNVLSSPSDVAASIANRFSSSRIHSRRKDFHLRYDRNRRTAASMQGSSYPPLNFSKPPPFTFCPTFGAQDELSSLYGPDGILRTRTHLGNTERIRKVLKRAMSGLPITIAVLGGSISSCHGLDGTPDHPLGNPIGPNCYPHRIFAWLNDVFPHPANELTNGALRRTGTSYFGFCSEQHLPDRADLILVEFDTEDPHDMSTLTSTDLLVRSLLMRQDQPAVILLGHFAPQIQGEHGFAGPEIYHAAVAQFYDIPHLSVKGLLYENYIVNPHNVRNSYFLDPVLANSKGHEVLADTVIAYLEAEVCLIWEAENYAMAAPDELASSMTGSQSQLLAERVGGIAIPGADEAPPSLLGGKGLRKSSDAGLDSEDSEALQNAGEKAAGINRKASMESSRAAKIPPFRIMDRPHMMSTFREIKPYCASANDLINPLPHSIFTGSGWQHRAPKPEDEDERHYWYAEAPGSTLKIPIKVAAGDIAVYYHKGPDSEGWGSVRCYVDDNSAGGVDLRGGWDKSYGQPIVTQIDRGVTKGPHFVVCELQKPPSGSTQFKIFGIFAT